MQQEATEDAERSQIGFDSKEGQKEKKKKSVQKGSESKEIS